MTRKTPLRITLPIVALVLFLIFSPTVLFAHDDIVGHHSNWPLDENMGTIVKDEKAGIVGTIVGSDASWTIGKFGPALRFEGGPGGGIALPDDFISGNSGTYMLWVKIDAHADTNTLLFAASRTDPNVYMTFSIGSDGKPTLRHRLPGDANERLSRAEVRLDAGMWHQVIFTANEKRAAVYIGGVEYPFGANSGGAWLASGGSGISYRIGGSPSHGTIKGAIDSICFFTRVLSVMEADALYKAEAGDLSAYPAAERPTLAFTASTYRVMRGGTTTLTWKAANVPSCLATGAWIGTVLPSGTQVVPDIRTDSLYFLTCQGKNYPVIDVIEITVIDPVPNLIIPPPAAPPAQPVPPPAPPSASDEPALPVGCTAYLNSFLKMGRPNDPSEVRKLQTFLNETIDAGLPITGYFGPLTHGAVKRFQVIYMDEIITPWLTAGYTKSDMSGGTGYVYKTTKYWINYMKCKDLGEERPDLRAEVLSGS